MPDALRQWRSIRSESVTNPRMQSHASNGAIVPPVSIAVSRSAAQASRDPHTTPPIRSLCPPMNFVAECRTYSNPQRDGLARYGDANVLSTTAGTPFARHSAPSASRSATVTLGFAIVST